MPTLVKMYLALIFLLSSQAVLEANQPIFILVTHPRATGTAFEKIIRSYAGIQVLHAPFLDPYLVNKYGPEHAFSKALPDPTVTFADVKQQLFQAATQTPLFFKESAYILTSFLKTDPNFFQHEQVKVAFLIRDPAKSVLSFYRKMPTVDASIVGHQQVWEIFNLLKDQQQETPLVIDSDEFLKNPLPILAKLGERWNLHFQEEHLHWESGYAKDWHLKEWYAEIAASTRLGPYRGDVPREADGTPTYAEVTDTTDRLRLQELYRLQNVYYQKLLPYAIKASD